ncbi:hypothetical protein C8R42DRAFT_647409 [Lentinula raphanica]|nr:hypothetical protein C8R42DRAFT_647409 [Lentinula raphanica]
MSGWNGTLFREFAARERINAKLPYAQWKEKVMEVARFFIPTVIQVKRSSTMDYDTGSSKFCKTLGDSMNSSSRPNSRASSCAPSRSGYSSHAMGAMTDFVKDGYKERDGCFRCCSYYCEHGSRNCPQKYIQLDHEYHSLDVANFCWTDECHKQTNGPVTLNEILAAKAEREKKSYEKTGGAVSSVVFAEENMDAIASSSLDAVASIYSGLPIAHHASGAAVYDCYAAPAQSSAVASVQQSDAGVLALMVESDELDDSVHQQKCSVLRATQHRSQRIPGCLGSLESSVSLVSPETPPKT